MGVMRKKKKRWRSVRMGTEIGLLALKRKLMLKPPSRCVCVWHDSFMYMTWCFYMCHMYPCVMYSYVTHWCIYMWPDVFICICMWHTWCIHVWHTDVFMCDLMFSYIFICDTLDGFIRCVTYKYISKHEVTYEYISVSRMNTLMVSYIFICDTLDGFIMCVTYKYIW